MASYQAASRATLLLLCLFVASVICVDDGTPTKNLITKSDTVKGTAGVPTKDGMSAYCNDHFSWQLGSWDAKPQTCLDQLCFDGGKLSGVYDVSPQKVEQDVEFVEAIKLQTYELQANSNNQYLAGPKPQDPLPFKLEVYCDQDTAGGGWIVMQRRISGNLPFNKEWEDYKLGFGEQDSETWLGNDKLHYLTALSDKNELRIEMTYTDGEETFAEYGNFKVASEKDGYMLTVEDFNEDSTAGDIMSDLNGFKFFTQDTMTSDEKSCENMGGFWMKDGNKCDATNVNAPFYDGKEHRGRPGRYFMMRILTGRRMAHGTTRSKKISKGGDKDEKSASMLKTVEMKFRPVVEVRGGGSTGYLGYDGQPGVARGK